MSVAKTKASEGARPLCMKDGTMPAGMHARVGLNSMTIREWFLIRRERRSLPLPEERMRQGEPLFQPSSDGRNKDSMLTA